MDNLIPFENKFLIPPDNSAVSLAFIIQPNEHDFEGEAAIALIKEALWVCYADKSYEVVPYQNIRETEVKDLNGISYQKYVGGKHIYVTPRDAWGVIVKHQHGNYKYSLTFIVFFANNAYQWKRKIEQAIRGWDDTILGEL